VTALLISGRTGCSIASDHVHDETDLWTGRLTSGPRETTRNSVASLSHVPSSRERLYTQSATFCCSCCFFCWDYGSADFNGLRLDNDFTRLLQNTNRKSQLNATIGVLLRWLEVSDIVSGTYRLVTWYSDAAIIRIRVLFVDLTLFGSKNCSENMASPGNWKCGTWKCGTNSKRPQQSCIVSHFVTYRLA